MDLVLRVLLNNNVLLSFMQGLLLKERKEAHQNEYT